MASLDAKILGGAGVPALVAGAACTLIAALVAPPAGKAVIAGVFATIVVIAFFSVGQVVLGRTLRNNPQMAMSVALVIYLAKIGVLFVLILLFADTDLFNTKVFALTIVVCTIVWTISEVVIFARTKALTIVPGSGPGNPDGIPDGNREKDHS